LFNFGVSRAFVFLPAPNICEFQMNFEEKFTRSIHRRSAIATLHRFNCAGEYIWQELSLGGPGNANLLIGAWKKRQSGDWRSQKTCSSERNVGS